MKLIQGLCVVAAMLVFAGCGGDHHEGDHDHAAEPGEAAMAKLDRAALDDPGRPPEEKAQDATRRAIDVYEWLGIQPGMTVADIFCADGYNTHLLSRVVGDQGKVFSVFEFYSDKEAFGGQVYKVEVINERVAANGLNNVAPTIKISELPPNSVDVSVIVRNYHDVEWVFPALTRVEVVSGLFNATKPGGVVGIVDVATDKEGWDQDAHRLNKAVVIADFTAGGFELVEESDLLANSEDDHTTPGFQEGRHGMDRYLLKFKKPA